MPDSWGCRGNIVQTPELGSLVILPDALVVVEEGRIALIGAGQDEAQICAAHGLSADSVVKLEVWLERVFEAANISDFASECNVASRMVSSYVPALSTSTCTHPRLAPWSS